MQHQRQECRNMDSLLPKSTVFLRRTQEFSYLSEYSCQGPDRPRDFVIQVVQVEGCYATEMGTVRERPEQA